MTTERGPSPERTAELRAQADAAMANTLKVGNGSTTPAPAPKRVRGPRKPKSPIAMAEMVHAEAVKGWTEADYALFQRVMVAMRGGA